MHANPLRVTNIISITAHFNIGYLEMYRKAIDSRVGILLYHYNSKLCKISFLYLPHVFVLKL